MKTTFKLGSIKLAFDSSKGIVPSVFKVAVDGKPIRPVMTEVEETPAKKLDVVIENIETSFECEVGELAEIYKVLGGLISNVVATVAADKAAARAAK